MSLGDKIKKFWQALDQYNKANFLDLQEKELAELETVFSLLVLGPVVGLPAPPSYVALELTKVMDNELDLLLKSLEKSSSAVGYLLGIFDID